MTETPPDTETTRSLSARIEDVQQPTLFDRIKGVIPLPGQERIQSARDTLGKAFDTVSEYTWIVALSVAVMALPVAIAMEKDNHNAEIDAQLEALDAVAAENQEKGWGWKRR